MHYSILASLALASTLVTAGELPVRTVFQFASNDTWLENVVTRSNGLVLATEIGPPASLLQFDPRAPSNSTPSLNITFDTVLGLTGITEGAHDVFYVTGANTTSANIRDPPTNATHIWQIDFNKLNQTTGKPAIKLIARPQAPTGLNGMAAYNETIILATATFQKSIFAIDVTTGYAWSAIANNLTSSINGIKVQDGYVYWTYGGDLVRAHIYPNITVSTPQIVGNTSALDDFAIAPNGFRGINGTNGRGRKYAYGATATGNTIAQISWNDKGDLDSETIIIAGSKDSTEIAEPTGAFFGHGGLWNRLFVTTGGASAVPVDVNGVDTSVGAQLLEIDLSQRSRSW